MAERQPTGTRIRERRQERGLRQAELAQSVGISPSYLNLIEHGHRRIGGKLLADIARALDLDPVALGEGPDGGRVQALRVAAAGAVEPLRPAPELARAQELADRFPGWAALLARQGARIEVLERRVAELAGRLTHDHDLAQALHQVISGVTAIRAASDILAENPDLDRDWQGRFLQNIRTDSETLAEASRALVRFLEAPERATAASRSPQEEAERWLDARDHHLPEVEVGGWPSGLPDGPAGSAVLAWSRRYAADAARLPLEPFAAAAREAGYDPAILARALDEPFARVLRRLASMPGGEGWPAMGLVICDSSGTVTHLRAFDGLDLPRSGGCPLWPLHEAFAQPGRAVRAFAALPGQGAPRLICHAVAVPREEPDPDMPPLMEGTMLVMSAPPGPSVGDRLVGPTCRICPRQACPARREPSILG
ncbi:helix-turn-helix domain-containing protein [Rubellimicrobium arenae]|uniref:helix-turn-helix domain-containing protein n=1 Tax=Rubellimicrobium arenae TaxID=2817372 RepID=UPI001B30C356|nr:helix-turn-helix domain-containing protein [Rubellimicrobium arenae]